MTIEAFEQEIQKIHPKLSILKSQNMDTAGVFFEGMPLGIAVPRNAIFDDVRGGYGLEHPNGNFYRHRTRPEALAIIRGKVQQILSDSDYADAMFGKGEYSDAKLDIK